MPLNSLSVRCSKKGELSFEHDGRPFNEGDIWGITNIGKGTKKDSADKIGRFGVGFKAVFAYTESPSIYSQQYSFRINSLVLPEAIAPKPGLGGKTRFEFPFNSTKKPLEAAFTEVKAGLESLSETTLLFLSKLHSISWKIGEATGSVMRIEHPENHIEILKEIGNRKTDSSHWLRFAEPVEMLPAQNAAIAFDLGYQREGSEFDPNKPLSKQMKISPARGKVSVFFPAEKETSELRFYLHAPFVPELSRASIKETDANLPLFEQLAQLSARSLHSIRDMGFLTGEFLAVLPNQEDQIPDRYQSIRTAIIEEMRNEPLTPKHGGGYACAKQLLQAKAALKELLSGEDLSFLLDRADNPQWAIGATQNNSLQDRFLSGLEIKIWDISEFIGLLRNNASEGGYYGRTTPNEKLMQWLSSKPLEWHQQMYSALYRGIAEKDNFWLFDYVKIVRLSDGSYGIGSKWRIYYF